MAEPLGLIRYADCAEEAWRNGAGRTRTLWSGEGARISVATLEQDAPFSDLAGYDRTFCVLGPGTVTLLVDGAERRLGPGEWTAFAGEAQVVARLDHGPLRAVNVMTLRGAARHRVWLTDGAAQAAMFVALAGGNVGLEQFDAGDLLLPPLPPGLAGEFLAVQIA